MNSARFFTGPRATSSVIVLAVLTALASGAQARRAAAESLPELQGPLAVELDGADAAVTESLDTSALTDDHSVNVPTSWWTYTNITAAQVSSFLTANGARLTDLEVYSVSSGTPRFTVRMVRNSGSYAVPGWWWYYGLTRRRTWPAGSAPTTARPDRGGSPTTSAAA